MTAHNVFTAQQIAKHHSSESLWISIDGKVYDVTHFAQDHPGGEELLFQFGGKDCTKAMQDSMFHLHSDVAYEMLQQFYIGDLEDSKSKRQISTRPFIDPYKPMLHQIWTGGFSKDEYLTQVHIARHVPFTAPIFGGPLEFLTKSPWWLVPMFWSPIISMILKMASYDIDMYQIVPCYIFGIFLFTLIEYSLHRFVFHVELLLPDHRAALTLHFLLHGVHHFLPMDRLRLVMPPALGFSLAYPFWVFFVWALPPGVGQAVTAGGMTGFVMYDMVHYYIHHGKPAIAHFKKMKTYHLDHHYKNYNLGYGITSKFWDVIFGTLL